MVHRPAAALGLDFGTESVRAVLVSLRGDELGSAVVKYRHGQIVHSLPSAKQRLPRDFALQHPEDWLRASTRAVNQAIKRAGSDAKRIVGIGVDFTSCTMLPTGRDGTPLCLERRFAAQSLAWPKLWKHHGAKAQTEHINAVARQRKEEFLTRYGGTIGLEWFFPKVLETLEHAPAVYDAAAIWIEAGDWFVWQLVGGDAKELPRSSCQAGYKAMWSKKHGYPSTEFLAAVHPKLANVVHDKMPGRLLSPGQPAGGLCPAMAKRFGLPAGIPVSAAIIDAHAGVPGAGAAEPGTLVMVLGTSSCHMLNAVEDRYVPGVAGVVYGGILPGYFGYETGQAAVGDAFDWLRRTLGLRDFNRLSRDAAQLSPGAEGVMCVDWFNGCRTPLMDGSLTGALVGLTLNHGPAHLYRAALEASAFGLRWIVELLREHKVPVEKLVATGGLPHRNPLLVQVYADVLGQPITIHPSRHGPALGAAILGAVAAGPAASGFRSPAAAIAAMAAPRKKGAAGRTATVVRPNRKHRAVYDRLYQQYRNLADQLARRSN
jgi:L-ribulokinase